MPADQKLFKRLSDSSSLTDVLIQMEDFLDSLDLYVFKNWFEGEIVQGPDIRRYWVNMTLKYDYKDMPDPAGGLRLIKHGAKVYFRKAKEEVPLPIQTPDDFQPGTKKPKMDLKDIWLVEIHIPRRFIDELNDDDLEMYDDSEVDIEVVSDARDEDIDDTDSVVDADNGESESDGEEEI